MYFRQFYLGCLAHASYLIGSREAATVVDPQRDVEQYLTEASSQGLKIKYVIETHLHADFVSGHRELALRTGAQIVFGRKARAKFPHLAVKEGDEIRVGDALLRILETPGHTPESICVLAIDMEDPGKPPKLLTGDTLFIGDVGRPDLAGSVGYTAEQMAEMLYGSLQKILKLPDEVEIYPAHGAGSMCGRNISTEASSTLEEQRRTNYALMPMPKADFVRLTTSNLPELPRYFSMDARINREGAMPLNDLPRPAALSPTVVKRASAQGALVLDVRDADAFGSEHLEGSLNIALNGQFASWAGSLVSPATNVILVADDYEHVHESVMRMARVGLQNVAGFLDGGIASWRAAGFKLATLPQWSVDELNVHLSEKGENLQIVDVRRPTEFSDGHVPGAVNLPLMALEGKLAELNPALPTPVICAGGYRSSAAASILQRKGFSHLFNVAGGTSAWIGAGFPIEK